MTWWSSTVDLEPALKKDMAASEAPGPEEPDPSATDDSHDTQRIPLRLVTSACPSLAAFCPGPVRHWHRLHEAACHVRPAMGVAPRPGTRRSA